MSFNLDRAQQGLLQETLQQLPNGIMAGAPEVLRMNMLLIKSIKGKRCLDVGIFTGSSALASALAVPPDGEVIGMDVDGSYWNKHGLKYAQQAGVAQKINARILPNNAGNIVLNELINAGESGRFDFCFIDANKDQYLDYYQKCMRLVRSGGIVAIDNVIWGANANFFRNGVAIDNMNRFINNDPQALPVMLNIAQGLTIVYKK